MNEPTDTYKPTVPAEVREAIYETHFESQAHPQWSVRRVSDQVRFSYHYTQENANEVCDLLNRAAPQPSADVEKVVEEIHGCIGTSESLHAHTAPQWELERIAAILTRARQQWTKEAQVRLEKIQAVGREYSVLSVERLGQIQELQAEIEREKEAVMALGRSFDAMRQRAETAEAQLAEKSAVLQSEQEFIQTLRGETHTLRAQLARICKEAFNNDDTIGGELADDYVIRQVVKMRNELARIRGQTNWQCQCGGTDSEGQKENEQLRSQLAAAQSNYETYFKIVSDTKAKSAN